MTATLFRDALLVTLEGSAPPANGDLLVVNSSIAAVGGTIAAPPDAVIVEARGKLILPGLVNAHTHSSETFFRGRYEGMPLEVWLLYAYPPLTDAPIPPRLLYLRTLLLAMESLKSGVTMLSDDFFDPPIHDPARLAVVFDAYEAAGIRANVSSAVVDIPMLDTLPFARDVVPAHLQALLDGAAMITPAAYAAFCRDVFATLHGRAAGRLRFMVAPSAPQRCTAEMLQACAALARDHGVPFHTHVLETKTQAVTGGELFGKSLIAVMADLGVLDRHTTIAHAVWVDDGDIAVMGEAGCAVVHNAVSNQKLGAGIAPLRRLIDAGVAIGLGTDGLSSNDTARIFDVMRVAALIHSTTGPDPSSWASSAEILKAATLGGARTALLDGVTGSLAPGKAADLIVLDLDALAFTPLNDPVKHLVWSENGSDIELVMVAGEVVVRRGRLTRIDEAETLAEIRDLAPAWLAAHARIEARNRVFAPFLAEIHRRAAMLDLGLNRYAGDTPQWQRRN